MPKPGGQIFCSSPLYFPEHQKPYDFFRYTHYGLRLLFENASFRIVRLEWLEGFFGTVCFQFRQRIGCCRPGPGRWPRVRGRFTCRCC